MANIEKRFYFNKKKIKNRIPLLKCDSFSQFSPQLIYRIPPLF